MGLFTRSKKSLESELSKMKARRVIVEERGSLRTQIMAERSAIRKARGKSRAGCFFDVMKQAAKKLDLEKGSKALLERNKIPNKKPIRII